MVHLFFSLEATAQLCLSLHIRPLTSPYTNNSILKGILSMFFFCGDMTKKDPIEFNQDYLMQFPKQRILVGSDYRDEFCLSQMWKWKFTIRAYETLQWLSRVIWQCSLQNMSFGKEFSHWSVTVMWKAGRPLMMKNNIKAGSKMTLTY